MFNFLFWSGARGPVVPPLLSVVAYSGSVASIPAGWVLCNGGSYALQPGPGNITTPNLNQVMICGANGTTRVQGNFYNGTQTTGVTDAQGNHSAFIGGGASYGGNPQGANNAPNGAQSAGNHAHTFLGAYNTLFPPSNELVYITNINDQAEIPAGAVIPFTTQTPPNASISYSGRYIVGVTNDNRNSVGSNTKSFTWTSSSNGAHNHMFNNGGPDTGSGCPCNGPVSSGDHQHSFTASGTASSVTLSDPSYIVVQYGTLLSNSRNFRNMILGTLRTGAIPDWVDCNGAGGTPDLRARYLRGLTGGENIFDTGGNTGIVNNLVNPADLQMNANGWGHGHFFGYGYSAISGGATTGWHTGAGFNHNHTVISTASDNTPPTYAMRFIILA